MLESEMFCPKCGGELSKTKTATGDIYECKSCHTKMYDLKDAPEYAEYRTERRRLEAKIERLVDKSNKMSKCPNCGSKAISESSSLSEGIRYTCKKCGHVQYDNEIKESLDELYNLRDRFPDNSEEDAIFYFLLIRVFSYNYTVWNDKIDYFSKQLNKTTCDIKDAELFKTYQFLLDALAKKSKKEVYYSNEKYTASLEEKKNKKSKRTKNVLKILFISLGLLAIAAGTIYFVKPELMFGYSVLRLYNEEKGSEYVDQKVIYSKSFTVEIPIKEGYTFKGYYDENNTMIIDENGNSVKNCDWMKETKNLHAVWKINVYTITLKGEGADKITNVLEYEYGAEVHLPKLSSTSTNNFLGWDNNGTLYTSDESFNMPSHNLEYLAIWDSTTFNVKFVTNCRTNIDMQTVKYGEKVSAVTLEWRFHTFKGWYKEEQLLNIFDFEKDYVFSDLTLYAKWEEQELDLVTYTIPSVPQSCAVDNDFDSSKPNTDEVANTEVDSNIVSLLINGCVKNSAGKYVIADLDKFDFGFKFIQDPTKIKLTQPKPEGSSSGLTSAHVSDDDTAKAKGTNLNERTHHGGFWFQFNYSNGTTSGGHYMCDFMKNQYKGSYISAYKCKSLKGTSNSYEIPNEDLIVSLNVTVVYEIEGFWNGFLGIVGKTYTNWRCDFKIDFSTEL